MLSLETDLLSVCISQFNASTGVYLGMYAATGVAVAIFTFGMGLTAAFMGFNVSGALHRKAIMRVLHAPMSLFDTTPLGRIMNRFSKVRAKSKQKSLSER